MTKPRACTGAVRGRLATAALMSQAHPNGQEHAMHYKFTVEVDVDRTEGKFASRDEIADQIQEALESADPQQYEGENGGQYETTMWEVSQ